jgi:hypothetical protein
MLEQLKAHAETLAGNKLTWVENECLSIGFDWESEEMYIIDRDHPDGAVIEATDLSINRVWDADMYPLPTQTTEKYEY